MTGELFEQRLAQLDAVDDPSFDALIASHRHDVNEGLVAVVLVAQSGSDVTGPRAFGVLAELAETKVEPLLSAIGRAGPAPPAWMLLEVAQAVSTTESVIVRRLQTALRDTRRLEPPQGRTEEPEPPFRVCDEAYLSLRRILHPESELQFSVESKHFLNQADQTKSQEISRYLETGAFTQFLENAGEEA